MEGQRELAEEQVFATPAKAGKRHRWTPAQEVTLLKQYLGVEPHDWIGKDADMWIKIASDLTATGINVSHRACKQRCQDIIRVSSDGQSRHLEVRRSVSF